MKTILESCKPGLAESYSELFRKLFWWGVFTLFICVPWFVGAIGIIRLFVGR